MCIINPLHKVKQIAAEHARLFREDTTFGRTLEDRIESAILDGIDSVFEREIAQTLRHTEEDREAWMKKYISAVAQLNAVKAACNFDASGKASVETAVRDIYWRNVTLSAELRRERERLEAMTQCRDDAVAAAHLMHEEKKP